MIEETLAARVRAAVKKHYPAAEKLSADLYAHPEVSQREFEGARRITGLLAEAGFRVEAPYGGLETAFLGDLDNGPGPAVGILVEYDALPEVGHGCGHNLHGAVSVLAGLALGELRDLFKGKLSVIGTPDEELAGGKIPLAEQGLFDGLALAMMVHAAPGGYCQANMDALTLRSYTLEFKGQAAHAAADPWKGRSALAAARKCLDLIDARRECFLPGIRVNGIITDGGRAVNVIPERAELRIEFRTPSRFSLSMVDDMVKKCARGAALALDCEVLFNQDFADFADMVRIPVLEAETEALFKALGAKTLPPSPPTGSSDVGNVSYRCPTVQGSLAITPEDLTMHTREFADATQEPPALEALRLGAELLVLLALKVYRDGDFRNRLGAEFQESLNQKLQAPGAGL